MTSSFVNVKLEDINAQTLYPEINTDGTLSKNSEEKYTVNFEDYVNPNLTETYTENIRTLKVTADLSLYSYEDEHGQEVPRESVIARINTIEDEINSGLLDVPHNSTVNTFTNTNKINYDSVNNKGYLEFYGDDILKGKIYANSNGLNVIASNLNLNGNSVITTNNKAGTATYGIVKPDNVTIIASDGVLSVVGGTGADNVYWATYGTTTASQVASAINDNKIVACEYEDAVYYLVKDTTQQINSYKFASLRGTASLLLELNATNDTWSNDDESLQVQLISGTNIKTINNTSILGSGNITIDSLPSQSGNSDKFLTTNGTTANWASLPVATSSTVGLVQPDNTSITVSNGTISTVDTIVIRRWNSGASA